MKLKKSGIFILILLLAAFLALNSMFTVRENEYACTVRFAKIIDTTNQAGLHFKIPFIDSVKYFPKATQLYDIPPSEVLTSDKQNMTVDCYILWSISDPKLFYQTLTTTANAEQRLDALTPFLRARMHKRTRSHEFKVRCIRRGQQVIHRT